MAVVRSSLVKKMQVAQCIILYTASGDFLLEFFSFLGGEEPNLLLFPSPPSFLPSFLSLFVRSPIRQKFRAIKQPGRKKERNVYFSNPAESKK